MNRRELLRVIPIGTVIAVPAIVLATPTDDPPKDQSKIVVLPKDLPIGSQVTIIRLGPNEIAVLK